MLGISKFAIYYQLIGNLLIVNKHLTNSKSLLNY